MIKCPDYNGYIRRRHLNHFLQNGITPAVQPDQNLQATLQAINQRLEQLENRQQPQALQQPPPLQPRIIAAAAGGAGLPLNQQPLHLPQQQDPVQLLIAQGAAGGQAGQGEQPLHENRYILGHTVPQSLRTKIQDGDFIELASLKKATDPEQPSTTSITLSYGTTPHINVVAPTEEQPDRFSEWLKVFLIFSSIHIQYHPSDAVPMFAYISTIQSLSQREAPFVWHNYDREFRKHYAKNNNLPWEKLDYEILHRLQPARSVQSTQPSYQQQPFQRATGGQPPDKACIPYYYNGFCKNIHSCPKDHLCGHCRRKGHNLRKCYEFQKKQRSKSRPTPNSNQR